MTFVLGSLLVSAALVYGADVCAQAVTQNSGTARDLSWSSSKQQLEPDKICTQHTITSSKPGRPLPVAWPEAGVLETNITGRLVAAFCCSENVAARTEPLRYGAPAKTVQTSVLVGEIEPSEEYPDLIEEDAKSMRSTFTGDLWDGGKYVRLDLELRVAAANPHLEQSVLQFVVTDQSSEPVVVDWDLVGKLSKTLNPFFTETPKDRNYRQSTYVFFAGERPAPARSVVVVKTATGRLLGRFMVNGFTLQKDEGKSR